MGLLQIHEPGETPGPHGAGVAVGIDLGTTHSVIALASGGVATVFHDICGGVLVPSVAHYGEDGRVTVGKAARALLAVDGAHVVSSVKRLMGRDGAEAKAFGFPHPVTDDGGAARFTVGKRALTPAEVSADILRHMKAIAEAAVGREVTGAVITVPAYFDDAARQATKDAARLAGLEVLRLINEPTAAALAYGLDKNAEGVYAVYDLGGGTFDISILKLEKGVFQVLATGGDIAIGGDDFDRAIVVAGCGLQVAGDPVLMEKARALKEQLSGAEEAVLEYAGKAVTVTRRQFNGMIAPYIARTLDICRRAMEDAGLSAAGIKGVVLVGGSTRIPYVRSEIEKWFGQAPLADINPDEVVAVGAAIQAEGLTQGSDNLLLDVAPLSLGLETMGGIAEKLIHRNTPIPVAVSQEFTTYRDGQTGMVIHVVQGEREMVEHNRSLARFELDGIPNLPAGIARIKVTFSVDADGLLSVSAREGNTGVEQSVAVKPSYGIGEEEIEAMLRESMEFARSDIADRLLREAEVEAERSLEEVKSALKSDGDLLDGQERAHIRDWMERLEETLATGDRDKIDIACEGLHNATRNFAEKRMDRAINSALKGVSLDQVQDDICPK
jgi:molecular chaperone HscA